MKREIKETEICVKCNNTDNTYKYEFGNTQGSIHAESVLEWEHLLMTCKRCEYKWAISTLDSDKSTQKEIRDSSEFPICCYLAG